MIAYDSLSPVLRATSDVLISVARNVNPPLFDQQQYQQTIPETYAFGRGVISVRATDRDNVKKKRDPSLMQFDSNTLDFSGMQVI